MFTQVVSANLVGIEAIPVTVETELTNGLPAFSIVGLGGTAVRESRFRVQAALRAIEKPTANRKITVNLAPADLRKDSSALDLSIALSVLAAQGEVPSRALNETLPYGELGLDGRLRPVRGVLAASMLAAEQGLSPIVPAASGPEAALVGPARVADSLADVVAHLRGDRLLPPARDGAPADADRSVPDLADVRGQALGRRALELAAAGGHNLLMTGHPGCGKTMLARRLPGILPPLARSEWLEVARIGSAAGLILEKGLPPRSRPFRAPHRNLSEAGLIGGGRPIRPGEVALAHHGVLFLDEMPELPRRLLEALRQPLEDREVVVVRSEAAVRFPAAFMLVGSMNPCPCGWYGHPSGRCGCDALQVDRYRQRLSGPLRDRFDLRVELPPVEARELLREDGPEEGSEAIRARVLEARSRAAHRRARQGADEPRRLRAGLSKAARKQLQDAARRMDLSARATDRTLRLARTVADMEGRPDIEADHVLEALGFR